MGGGDGKTPRAVLSRSTKGLRSLLKKEFVEFDVPLSPDVMRQAEEAAAKGVAKALAEEKVDDQLSTALSDPLSSAASDPLTAVSVDPLSGGAADQLSDTESAADAADAGGAPAAEGGVAAQPTLEGAVHAAVFSAVPPRLLQDLRPVGQHASSLAV